MSTEGKKPLDTAVFQPLPEDEEERNIELFKRWLKGCTYEVLAEQADISVTQIYRISKARGWKRYEKRRQERKYRKAAAEIDLEDDSREKKRQLVEYNGILGEWVETLITFPKGSTVFPGVVPLPPMAQMNLVILEVNHSEGFVRQNQFFPGGWKSPFKRNRGITDGFSD